MCDATIIIAAWNAADTIERSIDSAFNQDGVSVEVIVIDDASTDGTRTALSSRTDILSDHLHINGGPAQARNKALDLSRGRWIVVLDADDTMGPKRVSRMIAEAEATSADIVLGNFQKVEETGAPAEETAFLSPLSMDDVQPLTLASYVGRNQVRSGTQSIGYLKPILSRKFLERTALRYDPTLRNGEDCHLIFAALVAGAKIVISPKPDYFYTVRHGSISHRANPEHLEALIAADHVFLSQHFGMMDPATRQLFESRKSALTEMMMSERVMAKLKSGNILSAFKMLGQSPKTILRVARQIGEGTGRRLRSKY